MLTGVVIGAEFAGLYFPSVLGYLLTTAASFGVLEIVFFLLRRFLNRFLGHGLGWLMALVSTSAAVCFAVRNGAGEGWTWRIFAASFFITAIFWLLLASGWNLVHRGFSRIALLNSIFSAVLFGGILAFFCMDGFLDGNISHYLALTQYDRQSTAALEPSMAMGPYEVSVLDYGQEESLASQPVNLSSYMSRGDSMTEMYVDAYMDFELDKVPVRGRIWYPANQESSPVLFIAHGNHEITTPSYQGYAYLGEYLASHGYMVVSVDQNACNMLSNENDARAVLLLEHIRFLLSYNEEKGNPLYSKIDPENIAIAGHSRGGEMVATAYLFNQYDHYPENAVISFDYHFNIKSLIAIAPTVNQYKPADHSVKVEDVNYLLLHGAADRDVTNFMGMSQYENISFTGNGRYLKSALYIAGANHGQFNSLWGEYDCTGTGAAFLNRESLLSGKEQQKITCLFIKVFLDVTLRGDESCRTLLTDWEDYSAQLPETVYVQCHEESGFMTIADFEEDSEVETATLEGVSLAAYGVNWWTEDLMAFAGQSSYDTHALRLRWNDTATYTMEVPRLDLTRAALTFDICDLNSTAIEQGNYNLMDATIVLTDTRGVTATAQLRDFATVYPLLTVRTDKLDFIFDTPTAKEAFATVSIPSDAFETEQGSIDLTKIRKISFCFDDSGQVALDNIGITPIHGIQNK